MNYRLIKYYILFLTLLSACSKDDDVNVAVLPGDDSWTEEILDGASVTVKRFEAGDAATRSSLAYDGQSLIFGWRQGDAIGLYPTAMDATGLSDDEKAALYSPNDKPHPSNEPDIWRVKPDHSTQMVFGCSESNSQSTRIFNGTADFLWDDIVRWTAYFPFRNQGEAESYESRSFSFDGQKQCFLPEIGVYFDYEDATDESLKSQYLSTYRQTEALACEHLGKYDVMISPETKWEDGTRINFQLRHVGAIARLYLKTIEAGLIIKDVKLICETPVFYKEGTFNLTSHPYNATVGDFGVELDRTKETCQIQPKGDPEKMIQLNFSTECVTKKSGNNWGPYVVAYFMMYPINYDPLIHGDLFAYVTAYRQGDDPSKEIHYVSPPLAKKTMLSGNYYQWTAAAHEDDGLYPIELTATLEPWQNIVGGGISTDLEK